MRSDNKKCHMLTEGIKIMSRLIVWLKSIFFRKKYLEELKRFDVEDYVRGVLDAGKRPNKNLK